MESGETLWAHSRNTIASFFDIQRQANDGRWNRSAGLVALDLWGEEEPIDLRVDNSETPLRDLEKHFLLLDV